MLKENIEKIIEHLHYLQNLGENNVFIEQKTIDNLKEACTKNMNKYFSEDLKNPPTVVLPQSTDKNFLFNVLRAQISVDKNIRNHLNKNCTFVLGDGVLNPDLCIIGEAPGAEEEKAGKPFVGRAGKHLTTFLDQLNFKRDINTFITNIMLWRPELNSGQSGNRPPTQQEMDYCIPYLKAQLNIIQPKVILAVGATAVSGLFGKDNNRKITKIRGNWFEFDDIPTMISFHPSYLLRNNTKENRDIFTQDLIKIKLKLDEQK